MNWIELAPGDYTIRNGGKKVSSCQLEVDCRYAFLAPSYMPDNKLI
jgi:hypothetical protein